MRNLTIENGGFAVLTDRASRNTRRVQRAVVPARAGAAVASGQAGHSASLATTASRTSRSACTSAPTTPGTSRRSRSARPNARYGGPDDPARRRRRRHGLRHVLRMVDQPPPAAPAQPRRRRRRRDRVGRARRPARTGERSRPRPPRRTFNDMADAVQTRIEREVRFASDVSHELRSPITALSAAVEVLDARRNDLPDRTQQALDVVVSQIRRFDDMVIDLLELSRIDAGVTDLHTETVDLAELCDRVSAPVRLRRAAHRRPPPGAPASPWSTGSGSSASSATCSRTPRRTEADRCGSRSSPAAARLC